MPKLSSGFIVLVCAGGCGMTTEKIDPYEFWKGEVKEVSGSMIPSWTCKDCLAKKKKGVDNANTKN